MEMVLGKARKEVLCNKWLIPLGMLKKKVLDSNNKFILKERMEEHNNKHKIMLENTKHN